MFEVIVPFADISDSYYTYNVGDKYPRDGFTATAERIEELASDKNRRKIPLIKMVQSEEEEKPKEEKPKQRAKKADK